MAACFRLMSPLEIQEQEQQEEDEQQEQEKECLMLRADPPDLGHGKTSLLGRLQGRPFLMQLHQ